MNRAWIVGNLASDPEKRSTPDGTPVTNFTVAVNRRNTKPGQPDADFFRVTAWRKTAESCVAYLHKGRKVAVVGTVSASAYTARDGSARASLEITAEEVEFLSPKEAVDAQTGMVQVDEKMPWE